MKIQFTVHGQPQTAGSKRSFPFRRGDGSLGVRVTDDNPKGQSWKAQVASEAALVMRGQSLLDGPIAVAFLFVRPRPKGHFGARGNLLPSAPDHPTTKPDVLKLARAVEDALTGIIWRDDSQIVTERLEKRFGEPARVEIEITPEHPESVSAQAQVQPVTALPARSLFQQEDQA